jgi:Arylsulfotransferase (ASST)
MAKVLFVISLCILSFFYGVSTIYFEIFPYEILNKAKLAFHAWREVLDEDRLSFASLLFIDEHSQAEPQTIWFEAGKDDGSYILMTGGPYALMSQCPIFGCLAWIMNRRGEILHSWEVDMGELWDDLSQHTGLKNHENFLPMGLHLSDEGELLVTFQSRSLFPYGVGMAKFTREGKVLWKKANFSHHWFSVAPDGLIYTPAHRLADSPLRLGATKVDLKCSTDKIYTDVILVLGPDGETREEIPVFELLASQDFVGALLGTDENRCDSLHLNYIEYVTEERARAVAGLDAGDLVISARDLHMIAVIDGRTKVLKWVMAGRTVKQHSPRLLPDGSIIVFDNLGGNQETGGARIVRLTYGQDDVETVFPGPNAAEDLDFRTATRGHIDPSPDGTRALVSLSKRGRVLEIDLQHKRVLWEFVNSHDISSYAHRSGTTEEKVVGRLATHGAYYVGRPAFLDN